MSADLSESIYNDGFYADDWEILPCDYTISYQNVKLFFNGKSFTWYDDKGTKFVQEYDNNFATAYNYYYDVWKLSKKFGLPHSRGWAYEFSWVPDFIYYFDYVFDSITEYRRKRNNG